MRENYLAVVERVERAVRRCGRKMSDVKILAACKSVDVERIQLLIDLGHRLFGENYVQEAKRKIPALKGDVEWHLIGHLQTNKVKHAMEIFHVIETVDSERLAKEISRRAVQQGRVFPVLIEVNVGGEGSKYGVSVSDVFRFIETIAPLPGIKIMGLMAIPPFEMDPEKTRHYFRRMRRIMEEIEKKGIKGVDIRELSMGMSNDFEIAIEEGATIVRIGTAIFGERR